MNSEKSAIVIGGGLVGPLVGIFMARRGYSVQLYEKREDYREVNLSQGRSINLALSRRGREALEAVGLEKEVLAEAVPMKGRYIHHTSGTTKSIPYDRVTKQCLYSIGRNYLNVLLIKALGTYPNCTLNFEHKFLRADLPKGEVTFLNTNNNTTVTKSADIVIAADGAFSAVRQAIQKTSLLTFSQTYIEHGYLELTIKRAEGVKMVPNHLHIWPRNTFMMIALPNSDSSWTVTLFMPFKNFESISTPEKLVDFFKSTFPDYLNYVDESDLIDNFFKKKPMPLVSVKCSPYDHAGKFILIGDAAHAMVPFYGQGMNAGFEDCYLLNDILHELSDDIERSIEVFTQRRKDDAHAICDLAMYNYLEMRHLVTTPNYIIRKSLDEFLFRIIPGIWTPLYNSVTFSRMGYQNCIDNRDWQNKVLKFFAVTSMLVLSILFIGFIYFFNL